MGSEDEEEEVEQEGFGAQRIWVEKSKNVVKTILDPRMPTVKEVEEHNRTRLPCRNWCPHCVRAKGKDLGHRKDTSCERGPPAVSFDCCFQGNELGYKLTVLVGRERVTGMTMAAVLPSKGSTGKFAATGPCNESGDITIKTDQEAAIKCLAKALVTERGDENGPCTIVEETPVGRKSSNDR